MTKKFSIILLSIFDPVEMHLYAQGSHGFGVRQTNNPITNWPQLLETWLKTIGDENMLRNSGVR